MNTKTRFNLLPLFISWFQPARPMPITVRFDEIETTPLSLSVPVSVPVGRFPELFPMPATSVRWLTGQLAEMFNRRVVGRNDDTFYAVDIASAQVLAATTAVALVKFDMAKKRIRTMHQDPVLPVVSKEQFSKKLYSTYCWRMFDIAVMLPEFARKPQKYYFDMQTAVTQAIDVLDRSVSLCIEDRDFAVHHLTQMLSNPKAYI